MTIPAVGFRKPATFSEHSLGTACSNYEQWDNAGQWDEDTDPTARLAPRMKSSGLDMDKRSRARARTWYSVRLMLIVSRDGSDRHAQQKREKEGADKSSI